MTKNKVINISKAILRFCFKALVWCAVLLLILILAIILLSLNKRYSYKITGIHMQEVVIEDDTLYAGKKCYIVGADTEKDDYVIKIGFMIDWSRYYPKSSDSICNVSIENTLGENINKDFSTLEHINGASRILFVNEKDTIAVSSGMNASYMVHGFLSRRIEPNNNILIVLEDSTQIPKRIRVKLLDREIAEDINITPIHYRNSHERYISNLRQERMK